MHVAVQFTLKQKHININLWLQEKCEVICWIKESLQPLCNSSTTRCWELHLQSSCFQSAFSK